MSFNLQWFRPPTERKALGVGDTTLKFILADRYSEHDGSMMAQWTMTERDISFVEGLVAGGVKGADKLLANLREYKSLDLEIS